MEMVVQEKGFAWRQSSNYNKLLRERVKLLQERYRYLQRSATIVTASLQASEKKLEVVMLENLLLKANPIATRSRRLDYDELRGQEERQQQEFSLYSIIERRDEDPKNDALVEENDSKLDEVKRLELKLQEQKEINVKLQKSHHRETKQMETEIKQLKQQVQEYVVEVGASVDEGTPSK